MSFRAFAAALWCASVAAVIGGVLLGAIFGPTHVPLVGHMLARPHIIDWIAPIFIVALFAWVLFELALKQRSVSREHNAITTFQTNMAQADQNQYEPKAFSLNKPRAIRRADLIIECSRRDPSSLHEAVPAAAALDATTLSAGYGPLHVYAWILPVLGFIGTASGMSSAIAGFKDVLTGGKVQVEQLASQLSQSVIPGLAAAFETTILALGAALVAYLCTNALRSWDQEALDQLDRLCIVLLSRIPQPEGPEGKKVVALLSEIMGQLRDALQIPASLDAAASAITAAADSLASLNGESASAAEAIKSGIEALKKGNGSPPEAKAAPVDELTTAIKELQKAVSAPIHFTISRDTNG